MRELVSEHPGPQDRGARGRPRRLRATARGDSRPGPGARVRAQEPVWTEGRSSDPPTDRTRPGRYRTARRTCHPCRDQFMRRRAMEAAECWPGKASASSDRPPDTGPLDLETIGGARTGPPFDRCPGSVELRQLGGDADRRLSGRFESLDAPPRLSEGTRLRSRIRGCSNMLGFPASIGSSKVCGDVGITVTEYLNARASLLGFARRRTIVD